MDLPGRSGRPAGQGAGQASGARLYANLFARRHPQEGAAVLFLEATHPRDQEAMPQRE